MKRTENRPADCMRQVNITYNAFGYAAGNVLIQFGNTKVLCSATIQQYVPPFLKGTKKGWLTAEYAMLPTSTQARSERSTSSFKQNSRSVEISRLIGRSLRSIVNLEKIGERTIIIDCDVLQADGSTRTAAISGAYLALRQALTIWINEKTLSGTVDDYLTDAVAAVSVGIAHGTLLLDIDYAEDATIDADYNFILTKSGSIVEIQGSSEKAPISWQQFEAMRLLAIQGANQLFKEFDHIDEKQTLKYSGRSKVPLFSIANRQKVTI